MKRRTVLKGAAALALAGAPGFIRAAFAGEQCAPGELPKLPGKASAAVSTAFRAAQHTGRPLLVLVIPENPDQRWERGHAFGEWLNHGTAEQLRPLALVEVVCARMNVLKRLVPSLPAGEPLMVLVDTDQSPPTVKLLERELAARVRGWDEDSHRASEAAIDSHIATLSELLKSATTADLAATSRRRAQNLLALKPTDQARVSGDAKSMELELVERAAPQLFGRADAAAQLDAVVTARWKQKPPHGTRWANSEGCGIEIEGETLNLAVGCGMGRTPARSKRFLYFWAGQGHAEKPDEE